MSVSTTTRRVTYTANGLVTSFSVPFPFIDNSHLVVTKVLSGVTSQPALDVDYTVSGAGGSSGTITFITAPANTATITIERTVPLTQDVDFQTYGAFDPTTHEKAIDLAVMAEQQLDSRTSSLESRVTTLETTGVPSGDTPSTKLWQLDDTVPAATVSIAAEVIGRSNGGMLETSENGNPFARVGQLADQVAVSSSGTVTPAVARDQDLTITLTGNVTLANPTLSGLAALPNGVGRRLRVAFIQDATGYRSVTFGASYLISDWMPRQGPAQRSSVTFVQGSDGKWSVVAADGIDFREPFNVKDFGALGDGSTDDHDAIQAAIDAAIAYTNGYRPLVLIPSSHFKHAKPLVIRDTVEVAGQGQNSSEIETTGYNGPNFIMGSDHSISAGGSNGPQYVSALVGSGNALKVGHPRVGSIPACYSDLSQVPTVRLPDGGWEISFYLKSDTGEAFDGGVVWAINGSLGGQDVSANRLLNIQLQNTGGGLQPVVYLRDGSSHFLQTASHTYFADNTVYHFTFNWDGTHFRAFWNGELWTTGAFTPGAPLKANLSDRICIGTGAPGPFAGSAILMNFIRGAMDVFHVSNTPRHTATFTPANAKGTVDGNTLLLLNFDRAFHECMIGSATGSVDSYIVPQCEQHGGLVGVTLRDVNMVGGAGLYVDFVAHLRIENVTHTYFNDRWYFANNCFFGVIRNVHLTPAAGARIGINMHAASYTRLDNVKSGGPIGFAFQEANIIGTSMSVQMEADAVAGMLILGGGGTYNFTGFQIDDETSSPSLVAPLVMEAPQAFLMASSTLYGVEGPAGCPAALVMNTTPAVPAPQIVFDTCFMDSKDSSTPLISTDGSSHAFLVPIEVRDPWNGQGSPLVDEYHSAVLIQSGQQVVAVPASAGADGIAGQIAYDSSYIYICTATDTWERVAIATWP